MNTNVMNFLFMTLTVLMVTVCICMLTSVGIKETIELIIALKEAAEHI